ncbi:MAG: hypothetical protein V2I30_00435 [Erythrobacter sp.]|jgi:tetratricopeptide (TPR) repeat protein|nr:hypothetical protein [Erythrobacter sp.]
MAMPTFPGLADIKELFMRFAPAAAALSLFLMATASVTSAGEREPKPAAAALIAQGQAALASGDTQGAVDAFEAAFAVDPAYSPIFLELAEAARADGLQGKAIRYYREALNRDPDNFAAISGEGEALVEKGALEKAQRNLSRLESLCGASCPETMALQARISAGPPARLAVDTPEGGPTSN